MTTSGFPGVFWLSRSNSLSAASTTPASTLTRRLSSAGSGSRYRHSYRRCRAPCRPTNAGPWSERLVRPLDPSNTALSVFRWRQCPESFPRRRCGIAGGMPTSSEHEPNHFGRLEFLRRGRQSRLHCCRVLTLNVSWGITGEVPTLSSVAGHFALLPG